MLHLCHSYATYESTNALGEKNWKKKKTQYISHLSRFLAPQILAALIALQWCQTDIYFSAILLAVA